MKALYCYVNLSLLNKNEESVAGFVESMMEPLGDDQEDKDESIISQLLPAPDAEAPLGRSEGGDALGDGNGQ